MLGPDFGTGRNAFRRLAHDGAVDADKPSRDRLLRLGAALKNPLLTRAMSARSFKLMRGPLARLSCAAKYCRAAQLVYTFRSAASILVFAQGDPQGVSNAPHVACRRCSSRDDRRDRPGAGEAGRERHRHNKGASMGSIALRGSAAGVVLRVTLKAGSLTPGWHGVHLHAVSDCSDAEKFLNAKAHINHDSKKHGLLNAEGPDNGDIPNVFAAADGRSTPNCSRHSPR